MEARAFEAMVITAISHLGCLAKLDEAQNHLNQKVLVFKLRVHVGRHIQVEEKAVGDD